MAHKPRPPAHPHASHGKGQAADGENGEATGEGAAPASPNQPGFA